MSEMPCSVLAIRIQEGVCRNKLGCLCHQFAFPPFYQVDLSGQGLRILAGQLIEGNVCEESDSYFKPGNYHCEKPILVLSNSFLF